MIQMTSETRLHCEENDLHTQSAWITLGLPAPVLFKKKPKTNTKCYFNVLRDIYYLLLLKAALMLH